MATERFQRLWCPAPVLEHLAWSFAEVNDCHGTVEAGVLRFGNEVMNAVAKLVEEIQGELPVSQERGFLGRRLAEAT